MDHRTYSIIELVGVSEYSYDDAARRAIARASATLDTGPRQQDAEFGRNAGPGLLLQAALAQHAFEKGAVSNHACAGDTRGKSMRDFALKHRFPPRCESIIDPQIRSKERAFGCFAKVFERTKLDFQFTRFRNSCIGTVERAIGLCSAAPTGKEKRGQQRSDAPHPPHGVGRNTQIAAGSFDAARTATKSRSSSGTKSAVRAPDTVGTRAIS